MSQNGGDMQTDVIVSMDFDNKQFEKGVRQSIKTIDKLKNSMDFDKSVKSVEQLEKATSTFNTSNMEKSLAALEKRFSAFGIAGMRAVENVTDATMRMAKNVATKPFSIINKALGQIKSGGLSRALNLENARFQLTGLLSDLKDTAGEVNKIMGPDGPVQNAVKGTAYGLDAAAGAAAQLAASGVKVKDLEGPLTAISGAAAMTGRSYENIANIFSTVAGQGKLMTMQLRQFEAANVNVAAVLSKSMGKTEAEIRDMVQHGLISFEQFSEAMQNAFSATAKKANDTFNGALSNTKAALSRMGQGIMEAKNESLRKLFIDLIPTIDQVKNLLVNKDPKQGMIGGLESLRQTITKIGNEAQKALGVKQIRDYYNEIAKQEKAIEKLKKGGISKKEQDEYEKRKKIIKETKDAIKNYTSEFQTFLSGFVGVFNKAFASLPKLVKPAFTALKGIWNIVKFIGQLLKPVAQAFLDVFPPPTVKGIQKGAEAFERMTASLRVSTKVSEMFRAVFRAVFLIVKATTSVMATLFGWIKKLVKMLSPLADGLASMAAGVANFVGSILYYFNVLVAIVSYVTNYFGGIGVIFQAIVGVIAGAIEVVGNFLSSVFGPLAQALKEVLESFGLATDGVLTFSNVLEGVKNIVVYIGSLIIKTFGQIGTTLWNFGKNAYTFLVNNFGGAFTFIGNVVGNLFGALKALFHSFLEGVQKTGSILGGIKNMFGSFIEMGKGVFETLKSIAQPIFAKVIGVLGEVFHKFSIVIDNLTKTLTPSRIAALAFVAVMLMLSVALKNFLNMITETLPKTINALVSLPLSLSKVTDQAAGLLGDLRKKLQQNNTMTKLTDLIKSLAIAIAVLAGSLALLSQMDQDKLKTSAIVLGALTAGFMAFTIAIMFMAKHIGKNRKELSAGFRQIVMGMMAMGVAVAALAASFYILDGVNQRGLIAKALVIAALTAVLGAVARKMAKDSPQFTKGCVGILIFAFSLNRVIKALVTLTEQPIHKIYAALPALMLMMGMFGVLASIISKIKMPSTLGILMMIIGLKLCMDEIKGVMSLFAEANPVGFLVALGSTITAIVVLTKILGKVAAKLSFNLKQFSLALVAMAGATALLALVVKMFDKVSWSSLAKGLAVVATCMGLFIAMEALADKTEKAKPLAFAASLLLMGMAIMSLAGIALLFGLFNLKHLAKGMAVIAAFMGLFGGLMVLSQFTKETHPLKMGGMFLMLAGAIAMLVGVVVIFGLLDPADLVTGMAFLTAMSGVITTLIILSERLGKADPEKMGKLFWDLGKAIALISACAVVMGLLPLDVIIQGGATIAAFMAAMLIFQLGVSKIDTSFPKMAKFVLTGMLGVLTLVMTLALAMDMLQEYNWQDIAGKSAAISVAIVAFGTALALLGKIDSPDPSKAFAFALAAAALIPVAIALKFLADEDWNTYLAGAAGLSACILGYSVAFRIMGSGKYKFSMKQATSFLKASLIMFTIGGALAIVSKLPWKGMLPGAVAMAGVIVAYGVAFRIMSAAMANMESFDATAFVKASLALPVIAGALLIVAGQDWDGLLAGAVAIAGVLVVYGQVFSFIATCPAPEEGVLTKWLGASLAMVPIAGALWIVANQPWDSILASGAAMAAVLLVYGQVFAWISTCPKPDEGVIGGFVLGSLALVVLGFAIAAAASAPWQNALAAAAAISICLLSYGQVFDQINSMNSKWTDVGKSIAVLAAGCFAMQAVGSIIEGLAKYDWKSLAAAGVGIALCMSAFGGMMASIMAVTNVVDLGAIGKACLAIIAGAGSVALAVDEFVILVGGMIAGLGAIDEMLGGENSELSKWIEGGGKVLDALVGVLGDLLKKVIDIFGDIAVSLFGTAGECLSEFAEKATPFFDKLGHFDNNMAEAAKNLALTMLILGGSSMLDGLSGLVKIATGGLLNIFGNDSKGSLIDFADTMVEFDNKTKGITDIGHFKAVTEAAQILASLDDLIPNSGGVFQWFTGTTDWYAFKMGAMGMVNAMIYVSKNASQISKTSIELVKDCGVALGEMSDALPRDNGLIQTFTGSIDWYAFKNGVSGLTDAMVSMSTKLRGGTLNRESIELVKICGEMLAEMADKIPNSGGVIGWFAGENDLEDFAPQVELFGEAMAKFAASTRGVDQGAVERAKTVSETLIELVDCLGNTPRDFSFDLIFEVIQSKLPEYGAVVSSFSQSMSGASVDEIEKAKMVTDILIDIAQKASGNGMHNFSEFSSAIKDFGIALRSINTDVSKLDYTTIDEYADKLARMITSFNKALKGAKFENISGFSKTFKELNEVTSKINDDQTKRVKAFADQLVWLGDQWRIFGNKVKKVKSKDINEMIKSLKKLMNNFGDKASSFGTRKMDTKNFKNFEKIANAMGKIASLAKIANKEDGKGNIKDLMDRMKDLGDNARTMAETFSNISDHSLDRMDKVLTNLSTKFKAMGKMKTKNAKAVGEALQSISDGAKNAISDGLKEVNKKLKGFTKAGKTALKNLSTGLNNAQKLNQLKTDGGTIKDKVIEGIPRTAFAAAGAQVVSGFSLGLKDKKELEGVSRAAAELGEKTLRALNKKLKIESPSKMTKESGKYTVLGFKIGVDENIKDVYKSGEDMGDAALDGVKDSLDIHSPAGELIKAAYNAAAGWIKGCKDKAMAIFNSGNLFGGNFLGGLKNAIASVEKGKFNGDVLLDKFKDSLGLNKISDAMKQAVKPQEFDKAIAKGISAGAGKVKSKTAKAAGKAGHKAGKEFTDKMKFAVLTMVKEIKGWDYTKLVGKDLKVAAKDFKISVDQYRKAIAYFKQDLGDFSDDTKKWISKNPTIVKSYMKKFKDATQYAKGTVTYINKNYKDLMKGLSKTANEELKGYKKQIKALKKERESLNKIANSKGTKKYTAQQKKDAKKQAKAISKEIKNIEKKMKTVSPGAAAVNNFAEKMYENSSEYKKSKKTIESLEKSYAKEYKKFKKYLNVIDNPKATDKQKKKAYDNLEKSYSKLKDYESKAKTEWDKIAKGPEKAYKEWAKNIKSMIKEITKLDSYELSSSIKYSGFDKVEKAVEETQEAVQKFDILANVMGDTKSKFSIFAEETSEAFDMFSVSMDESADTTTKALSGSINLLEKFTKVGTAAKDALFENANSQLKAYDEFMEGVAKMSSMGFNADLVSEMAKQGPQAMNYIRGFLQMSTEEVASYNEKYAKKLAYEADERMEEYANGAKKTTKSYLQAVKDSIDEDKQFETALNNLKARGVSDAIIDKFRSMGRSQAKAYVDSLLAETDEGIKEFNDLYKDVGANETTFYQRALAARDGYTEYQNVMSQLEDEALGLDRRIIEELKAMDHAEAVKWGKSILNDKEHIDDINKLYASSIEEPESVIDSMKAVKDAHDKFEDDLQNLEQQGVGKKFVDYIRDMGVEEGTKYIERLNDDFERNKSKYEGGFKEYLSEIRTLFESSYETPKSDPKDTINDNLQSQIDAINKYNDDLDYARSKFQVVFGKEEADIYTDYLKSMGLEGANYVEELAHMSMGEIVKFRKLMRKKQELEEKEDIKYLQEQQKKKFKTLSDYGKNLQILASAGANETFLQSILDMGVEQGSAAAEAYVNMYEMDPSAWSEFRDGVQKDSAKAATTFVEQAGAAMTIAANYDKLKPEDLLITIAGINKDGTVPDQTLKKCKTAAKTTVETYADSTKAYASSANVVSSSTEAGKTVGTAIGTGVNEGLTSTVDAKSLGDAVKNGIISAFGTKSFVEGLKNSFKDKTVGEAAVALAKDLKKAFTSRLNKEEGEKVSTKLCNGLIQGFKTYKAFANDAAKKLAQGVKNSIEMYLNEGFGRSIGEAIGEGLIAGMDSELARVQAKAAQLAQAAAAAMAAAARVNSPSKVTMEIGGYIGEGLVLGMAKSTESVVEGSESLAEYALSAIRSTAQRINDEFNSIVETNPVITPTLDLSGITRNARELNSMFNAQIDAKASANEDSSENQNGNGNMTFVQNNYSPKALSREEIYRQTRNQFALAREAVRA